MVVRGLVSSPLLHGAAADALSHRRAASLSHTPRRTCSVSLRAAHVRIYFTGWQRGGYLSAAEPGLAKLLSANSDRVYIYLKYHGKGKRLAELGWFVLLLQLV